MYPNDPIDRFWVDVLLDKANEFAGAIAKAFLATILPAYKNFKENSHKFLRPGDYFEKSMKLLDETMTKNRSRGYLVSDAVTVADIAWYSQMWKVT